MSCCGCASRVLKLQSEIRSWKTKLADEKREKKMIMRWIMAVFGYDVRVDIDKETHTIRLQATENKEAVTKALIKLGLGGVNEGDVGMMVMELKLEDHEFYESFEEPHNVPEFPILEINSMSTHTQVPLVNTGMSSLGHVSQHHTAPPLSITTPMEVAPTPLPIDNQLHTDQEVMYIAGNLEEGATIEGPNGQSYIIVRANESEDLPMQLDYAANDGMITDGSNIFFRPALPTVSSESHNAINYLATTSKSAPVQLTLPTVVTPMPVNLPGRSVGLVPDSVIEQLSSSVFKTTSNPIKPPSKKKSNHSTIKQGNQYIKKQNISSCGETNIKIKSVFSSALPSSTVPPKQKRAKNVTNNSQPVVNLNFEQHSRSNLPTEDVPCTKTSRQVDTVSFTSAAKKETFQFGLTLREKAEMYVLQKAKEAVEKVSNGFRCSVCLENRYTFSNFETAVAHAKTHFESKPYKCDFCNELFGIQKELLIHRKTVHPKCKGAVVTSVTTSPSSSSSYSSPSRLITQATYGKPQQSPNVTQTQSHTINMNTNNIPIYSVNNPINLITASGNTAINSFQNVISGQHSHSIPQQTKTIVVQAPFDNNLLRSGPISISSEVLAALLGLGGGGVTSHPSIVTSTSSVPLSKFPTFVLATQSGIANNKLSPCITTSNLNSVIGSNFVNQNVDTKTASISFKKIGH